MVLEHFLPLTLQALEFHTQIAGMGWNDLEQLVVVLEYDPLLHFFAILQSLFSTGTVLIYSLRGELLRKFEMDKDCKKAGIHSAVIWGTGFVCLTKTSYFLYALKDFDSPIIIKLKNPGNLKPLYSSFLPSRFWVVSPGV